MIRNVLLMLGFLWAGHSLVHAQDEINMVEFELEEHEGKVMSVDVSNNDQFVASGGEDRQIVLWNTKTGEIERTFPGYSTVIYEVVFSRSGDYLLGCDKKILFYKDYKELTRKIGGHSTSIWSCDMTKDNELAITGSFDEKFILWDVESNKPVKKFDIHEESVLVTRFSPDENYFISASAEQVIKYWNLHKQEVIHTLRGHSGNIYDAEFTQDGKYLITASEDKSIKIYDLDIGKSVKTLRGHGEAVMAVSLSPDGKHLLSASWDKTIKLWNLVDGEVIYTFNNHEGVVNDVQFFSDGERFVSGAAEGELFLWKLNPAIFVEKYYKKQFDDEVAANELFEPRRDGEKRSAYKERQEKQKEMKKIIYEKYYQQYKKMIKNKPLVAPDNPNVNIRIE